MKKVITRRSALKKVAGTAGAAVAASLAKPLSRASAPDFSGGNEKQPYEPPSVAWQEKMSVVTPAVSCAREPGNPGCNPGPTTT